jgi:hypothetical protein
MNAELLGLNAQVTGSRLDPNRRESMNKFLIVALMTVCFATGLAVAASVQPEAKPIEHADWIIATLHAEGAQIYQCNAKYQSQTPALSWQFREPAATLVVDGKTVGHHSAGPNWDLVDGSGVKGKIVSSSMPSATSNDIPWLKLDVIERRGSGMLSEAEMVERVNTKGGVATGPCESAGAFLSIPYSADYVFLRKTTDVPIEGTQNLARPRPQAITR